MPKSMTIGEFINECYAYPYSQAYFQLYKEGLEFDLVAQYLESMDAREEFEMVESGAVSDPNYFCPYDESVEEKFASYFIEKDTGDGLGESWDKDLPFFPRVWNWIKITAKRFWNAIVSLFKKTEQTEQSAEEAEAEEEQAVEQANEAAENGQAEGADGTGTPAAPAASGSPAPESNRPRISLKKAHSLLDYKWTTAKVNVLFKDKAKAAWANSPFQGRLNPRHVMFDKGVSPEDKKAVINFVSFVREKETITVSLKNKEDVKRFMSSNGHTAFEVDRVCDFTSLGELYNQVGKISRLSDLTAVKARFYEVRRHTLANGITVKCGEDLTESVKALEAIRDNVDKVLNDALTSSDAYKKAAAGAKEKFTFSDYDFTVKGGPMNDAGKAKIDRRQSSVDKMVGMGKVITAVSKLFSESCGSTLAVYVSLLGTMRRYHAKGQLNKLVLIASGRAK